MAWTILSTEQASIPTNKGDLYFVLAHISESLTEGSQYSSPYIPQSTFSGYTISIFRSSQAFTPFESNNGRIKAYYDENLSKYVVDFLQPDGVTVITSESFSNLSNYTALCWVLLVDPNDNAVIMPAPFFTSSSNMQRLSYNTSEAFGAIKVNRDWATSGTTIITASKLGEGSCIMSNILPEYTWTAWDQIAGNGGQYRCNLTKIKDDSIGNFSSYLPATASDFDRISAQSSLWSFYQNAQLGDEVIVAWSGNNWATLTCSAVTGQPNQVKFTVKFYLAAVSSSTPVYTYEEILLYSGTPKSTNYYMTFVHDDTQQAAVFLPAKYTPESALAPYGYGNTSPTSDEMLYLWLWLQSSGSPSADSPYSTGTTDDGGNPGGPTPQDQVLTPSAPTLDGCASGLFTIYCPDDTELGKISSFLWDSSTISSMNKYFNNFSDNIISLYVLPYKGTNLPNKAFTVGNLTSPDADLSAVDYITSRFVKLDMGSVTIKPFWDSYLDYSPYSKMEIYLPGCGVQQIDVDDIMCPTLQDGSLPVPEGSTISLEYMLDLMTGVLVAFVKINGELRYQFPGKIGYQIPLTGENYASLVRGYITATAGLIGMAVTGGAAAPFAAGAAAAGIINAMKPDVYRGGNLSGDASMLSYKTPYLIYRRPNKPLLNDQEKFTGFPSYKIDTLSNFSGYTEVIDCHVEGFSCTDEEREKILAALKGGVII